MALAPVVWADDFVNQSVGAYSRASGYTFTPTGGRGGRGMIDLKSFVDPGVLNITVTGAAGATLWIIGVAVKPVAFSGALTGAPIALLDASQNVLARITEDWHVVITGTDYGLIPVSLPPSTIWTHVIFRVFFDASAGFFDVRFNEAIVLSRTGLNTGATTPLISSFAMGGINHEGQFCDYYVQASSTSSDEPLGDRAVSWLTATGAGTHTDWTPHGESDNWECVDETPPDGDTSYVSSDTPGDVDTYAVTDLAASTVSVDAVVWKTVVKKSDAGSRTVAPVIRIGGTDYEDDGDAQPFGTDYQQLYQVFTASPATSDPWTPTEVNGMELGLELVS